MSGVSIRLAEPRDTASLRALSDASADGGAVTYRLREHVAIADGPRADGTESATFVAEVDGAVVGSGRVTLGRVRYSGEERAVAHLGALAVHPAHRRRGIGAELARRRIAHAEDRCGADVIVLADIQAGNAASLANARRWATDFLGPCLSTPVPVRRRPPRPASGVTVRDVAVSDLASAAAGYARFTRDRDFAKPWTADSLAAWLADSPVSEPARGYRVALDASGELLAGLALRDEGRLRSMEIVHLPLAIRIANVALRVVPSDRVLRNIAVEHLWFAPGRADAARALWQDTRWAWRDRGSTLLATLDARDPTRRAIGLAPWSPTTSLTTAARLHPRPDARRLLESLE